LKRFGDRRPRFHSQKWHPFAAKPLRAARQNRHQGKRGTTAPAQQRGRSKPPLARRRPWDQRPTSPCTERQARTAGQGIRVGCNERAATHDGAARVAVTAAEDIHCDWLAAAFASESSVDGRTDHGQRSRGGGQPTVSDAQLPRSTAKKGSFPGKSVSTA